jgi:hypothetical protein
MNRWVFGGWFLPGEAGQRSRAGEGVGERKYFRAFLPFLLFQLYFSRCLTEVAIERT